MRYLILLLMVSCVSRMDPIFKDAVFQMDTKDFEACKIDAVIVTLSTGDIGYLRRPEGYLVMVEYRQPVLGEVRYSAVSTDGDHTWMGVVGDEPVDICCGVSCE